jgi:hypothetical protein
MKTLFFKKILGCSLLGCVLFSGLAFTSNAHLGLSYSAEIGVVNSQFTKTCFSDGHIEAIIYYTDGTHYTYPTEWLDGNAQSHRLPHKGDWKHIEWVWRNNQWVETVRQNY